MNEEINTKFTYFTARALIQTLKIQHKIEKIKSNRSNCCITTDLNVRSVCITALNDRNGKLLHEIWQRAKFSGKHKIKQRPQLLQVVLDRRSGQNQAVTGSKLENGENENAPSNSVQSAIKSSHHVLLIECT